jgi:hypothetical protein
MPSLRAAEVIGRSWLTGVLASSASKCAGRKNLFDSSGACTAPLHQLVVDDGYDEQDGGAHPRIAGTPRRRGLCSAFAGTANITQLL